MYKLHYCFMREACQFACFEQNTSAELHPLHCILCSTTGERESDGKDWLGPRSWTFATHVISLQARSQADRQQLCTLEHPLWQGTVTFHGDLLHRHRRFPSVRLALHRDAQRATVSPRQHEHDHGSTELCIGLGK